MSIKALKSAENRGIPVVMAAQKDPAVARPGEADIYRIGVVGNLIKLGDCRDGTLKALIEGKRRVQVTRLMENGEFMKATTEDLTEPAIQGLDKLLDSVASAFVASRYKSLAANRSTFVSALSDASVIADRIASQLPIEIEKKQELLETIGTEERLGKILAILNASK
jgi:ATP-dependent Lon protease